MDSGLPNRGRQPQKLEPIICSIFLEKCRKMEKVCGEGDTCSCPSLDPPMYRCRGWPRNPLDTHHSGVFYYSRCRMCPREALNKVQGQWPQGYMDMGHSQRVLPFGNRNSLNFMFCSLFFCCCKKGKLQDWLCPFWIRHCVTVVNLNFEF